jgi:hypothetical protein
VSWEVSLYNTDRLRFILLIAVLRIGGKQRIKRGFLSYPQLWIMLFVSFGQGFSLSTN